MQRTLLVSLRMVLVTAVIFGLLYPLVVWGLASVAFPNQATGSIVMQGGEVRGSRLIGQAFKADEYFHGRPSAAGGGYDPMSSGASNLGPTSRQLILQVGKRLDAIVEANPGVKPGDVPVDLVTSSASGLDPHISPQGAYLQVERVARARNLTTGEVRRLIDEHVDGRDLGFLGEPRVNVLELNLALDSLQAR